MSISMAITSFNRCQMTIDSFAQIIDNDFISEFIIVDDASTDGSAEILKAFFKDNPKVKIYVNKINLGMSRNKAEAISLCNSEYVLIADSDNIFKNDFIDNLRHSYFTKERIICPDFAAPNFDYTQFSNSIFNKENIYQLLNYNMGNCCINTCNYIVNKEEYLKVYDYNPEMRGTDTIWFAYLWLKAGNEFYIENNLRYIHTVWEGSEFLKHVNYNLQKAEEVRKLILQLSE